MADEILVFYEADQLVQQLFVLTLHDIGGASFLKQHEVLQKLNMQAHYSASHETEDFVSGMLATHGKYDVLVQNLITLAVFRHNLYERLLNQPFNLEKELLQAHVLCYAVFFHEAVILDLLSVRAVDQLFETRYMLELVDYVTECLNQVISGSYAYDYKAPEQNIALADELRFSAADVDFRRNVTAFTLLRALACNEVPLQAYYRLKTNRLQVKAAQVLTLSPAPWVREVAENGKIRKIDVFENLEWRTEPDLTALRFRLQQTYAQLFIALLGLARLNERFTPAEIDVFVALKGQISESYMDQISELRDLRVYYEKLALSQQQTDLAQQQDRIQRDYGIDELATKPIVVEVVSSLETQIKEQAKARIQAARGRPSYHRISTQVENGTILLQNEHSVVVTDQELFDSVFEQFLAKIAAFDLQTNTICDEYDKVFPHCVCGKVARNRCSKCRKAWYCSRECQVRDWKAGHKAACRAPEAAQEAVFK